MLFAYFALCHDSAIAAGEMLGEGGVLSPSWRRSRLRVIA